ncbi:MAG: cell division regulator GpsB [Alkalibacterium gilvum]|uniref:cell division regulator GpsB n=1 Tax=Alkalibacterium TaxID=99906 RepID=UPI000B877530|nr:MULTISPECIES: cell division regulator GpsB [Alkalibacterium]MDN6293502.1 cell division regulator GpsB [Alkalibacterium sp.]MDN6295937.1 cell division regulator GpsB [Alkalibacterium sp.]MDN6398427.1 cell division regulator GpsB [Alkalibacterium sp.]MDN6730248.1 cell division regulator GpsB [Alkalibacterium sp.]HAJ70082.1 cell division regulator GpsB [Alkalibacterium sp.]
MDRELTQKEILEKDFKTKMRGYDPTEVDEFLDVVIRDYDDFQKEIEQLKAENDRLLDKVDEQAKQMSTQNSSSSQTNSAISNFDILKRLSNLERHVFGSKLDSE